MNANKPLKIVQRSIVSLAILGALSTAVDAREQIQIVGSSTVYPFSTLVAERCGSR